jgi:hypothetical protein
MHATSKMLSLIKPQEYEKFPLCITSSWMDVTPSSVEHLARRLKEKKRSRLYM